MERKKEFLGAALAMGGGLCWAISGCCGQFLFSHKGMDVTWLVPIRLFAAGVLLLFWHLVRTPKLVFAPWRERRDRRDLLVYGLLGVSLCQFLYFDTIQLSSAGVATILQDLSPLIILLLACLTGRRWPHGRELLSIALALGGVFLLVTHGSLTNFAVSPAALATGVLSALCVTLYNVYPRRLLSRYPVPLLQGWAFFMGGIAAALVFRSWRIAYTPDWVGVLGIGVCVVVGNLMAFTLYMQGVKLIGPSKAVLYGFTEPVAAAILSFVWLGAPFGLYDFAGFVCVLAMVCLISRANAPAKASAVPSAVTASQTR